MHTQGGQVHQLPSYSRWTAPGVEVGKTSAGQRATLELLPGRDQAATGGRETTSVGSELPKQHKRKTVSQQSRALALQLRPLPTAPALPHTGYQDSELLLRSYKHLTFPYFLLVMKRTEQWPTESLTKQISVTNTEQTRPHLADEQRS